MRVSRTFKGRNMSKKDFIALADALRGMDVTGHLTPEVINALCAFMRHQNPRFMEVRWREYLAGKCGPNGGKVKAIA
jgi:hypothetical protein